MTKLCIVTLVTIFTFAAVDSAFGYTPESPEVKAMIAKGAKYLEKAPNQYGSSTSHEGSGLEALVAYTLLKAEYPTSHPRISKAISHTVKETDELSKKSKIHIDNMYTHAVWLMLLVEVDPVKYRPQIEVLVRLIVSQQKANGGWGYATEPMADFSQIQYCVLAIWTAEKVGVRVPDVVLEKAMGCMFNFQFPDGSYPYRSGENNHRQSMGAAGMGTVYILAGLLGLQSIEGDDEKNPLPPSLVRISKKTVGKRVPSGKISLRSLYACQSKGNSWNTKNFTTWPPSHQLYFMYTLERYQSFRELAENKRNESPDWYNACVDELRKKQANNGSFGSGLVKEDANTCFGLLFLMRNTQKAIKKAMYGEGVMVAGQGLNGDTSRVRMKNGRVVAAPVAKSFNDMMAILEDPDSDELSTFASFPDLLDIKDDPEAYKKHAARLRRLGAHESYQVRMVAIRMLALTGDLDNVETLIYALTDPDWRIAEEARDGLRFISRHIEGYGLTKEMAVGQRGEVIHKWKEWYYSVRPEARP